MKEVMMVAAEASSSAFALKLLEHWKAENSDIHAFGVGSLDMEKLGFERLGKSEEMAVVGAAEIIEHWGKLRSVFNSLVEAARSRRPKLVVVMDYPEFNLYLSRKLHALGIPVIYYVSPQVWAWRKGRVQTIKRFCRKILVLFPFELSFYQEKAVPVEFVGHPILDDLNEKYFDSEYIKQRRQRYGISESDLVIGLMPGSRRIEIRQHLQIQLDVARKLCASYPKVRVLLLLAPTVNKEQIQAQMGNLQFPVTIVQDDPLEMIALTDFVLAKSGTATLMVGLLNKPMVIMYKMSWVTGIFAKIFVRGVRFFGLVNLILGREVVAERWQAGANSEELFKLMKRYLDDSVYTQKVRQDLASLKDHLGNKGATKRVAKALEEFL